MSPTFIFYLLTFIYFVSFAELEVLVVGGVAIVEGDDESLVAPHETSFEDVAFEEGEDAVEESFWEG